MCLVNNAVYMFSPPYGDGTKISAFLLEAVQFSLPYGDCTDKRRKCYEVHLFSPPCGDGTEEDMTPDEFAEFSPPYGDCTLNISQNTAKLKSRMARKYSLYYNNVLLC